MFRVIDSRQKARPLDGLAILFLFSQTWPKCGATFRSARRFVSKREGEEEKKLPDNFGQLFS